MTDFPWPTDLVPSGSSFKLRPKTGGSQSPFNDATKIYGLSRPLWTCSLSFRAPRGMRWGDTRNLTARRIDALLAKLQGRVNRLALYDFDFPEPIGALATASGNVAAIAGDAHITATGMTPGATVLLGSYVGGDGRPHLVTDDVVVAGDGTALVPFTPAMNANVALNAATWRRVTGFFRLTDDGLGDNFNEVDQLVPYSLQFIEDPGPQVNVTFDGDIVTYSG
jgi:hypothetical protein